MLKLFSYFGKFLFVLSFVAMIILYKNEIFILQYYSYVFFSLSLSCAMIIPNSYKQILLTEKKYTVDYKFLVGLILGVMIFMIMGIYLL